MTETLITPDDLAEEAALEPLPEPRPPQGITIRFMQTGDRRHDFHKRWTQVPVVDPASLLVDGLDPFLALPIGDDAGGVRIKQVKAEHAAELLTCDHATGAPSTCRLATDREVDQYHQEAAARAAKHQAGLDTARAREIARNAAEAVQAEATRRAVRDLYTKPDRLGSDT